MYFLTPGLSIHKRGKTVPRGVELYLVFTFEHTMIPRNEQDYFQTIILCKSSIYMSDKFIAMCHSMILLCEKVTSHKTDTLYTSLSSIHPLHFLNYYFNFENITIYTFQAEVIVMHFQIHSNHKNIRKLAKVTQKWQLICDTMQPISSVFLHFQYSKLYNSNACVTTFEDGPRKITMRKYSQDKYTSNFTDVMYFILPDIQMSQIK